MAGKRQHYIPRFLQRGFLADDTDDAERTWLYRRGAAAKLVGIADVGVGEYFYSRPSGDGSQTLDDQITDLESQAIKDLRWVKSLPSPTPVDSSVAARLLTHLVFRTAHVRSSISQMADLVLDHMGDYIQDTDRMHEELNISGTSVGDGGLLDQALSSKLTDGLPLPPALAKRLMMFMVREQFDDLYAQIKPQMAEVISALTDRVKEVVQGAHRDALEKLEFTKREENLAALSWTTRRVSGAVLPDCIAIARESNGVYAPLLLADWEVVDCVALPLSSDIVLVGFKGQSEELFVAELNRASSACSDSFFISKFSSYSDELSPLIGERCAQVISSGVSSALTGAEKDGDAPADKVRFNGSQPPRSVSFTLSCLGFGDESTVTALGGVMHVIVGELSRYASLSELEGVVFAANYEATVEQLENAGENVDSKRASRDYGQSVAKCISVVRQGLVQQKVVFDASVAYVLLDQKSEGHSTAMHVVVSMLSQVAHEKMWRVIMKDIAMVPIDDTTRFLYRCVSASPAMYFGARQSAFADSSAGERFATLMLDSYNSAVNAICDARAVYERDGNLDGLLDVALPRISYVLEHAAQWLGHRDGLPSQERFAGAWLVDELKSHELDRWLELFGRDLRRIYAKEVELEPETVYRLGANAERLLWTVQLFPWPMDDGRMYVTVVF